MGQQLEPAKRVIEAAREHLLSKYAVAEGLMDIDRRVVHGEL